MPTEWNPGPTVCANPACGKSLKGVNPYYGIAGAPRDVGYCSRACRATKTGENVPTPKDDAGASGAANVVGGALVTGAPEKPPAAAKGKGKKAMTREDLGLPMPSAGKQAKAAPKADTAAPSEPKPKAAPKAPGAPRASAAPWANLEGKLHLTGKKPPNFQGNRKQVWEMIKEGMTVKALYDQCEKAGLDGKSNLAKIIGVYGCAEVR